MSFIKDMKYVTNKQKTDFFKSLSFVYSVHLRGSRFLSFRKAVEIAVLSEKLVSSSSLEERIVYFVHLPGLEPGTTVPKTAVISISPQVHVCFILYKDVEIIHFYVIM